MTAPPDQPPGGSDPGLSVLCELLSLWPGWHVAAQYRTRDSARAAGTGGKGDHVTADRELVGEIADRYLPEDVAARWARLLRPAAALRHAGPGARVAAVLGGEPGLPDWVEWPVWEGHGPLSFVAAIDCAALAAVPLDITLPSAGMLLFFYFDGQYDNYQTTVGFWEPSTLAGARVLHIGPGEATSPRACPAGLKPYQRVELTAEPVVSFPQFEHPDLHAVFKNPGADLRSFLQHPVNGDAFLEALSKRNPGSCHQVGGYATLVQGPVEYEVATAALGGGIRGEDRHVSAEQARWTLLAQIDTDDRAGMMWGDCGAPYWLSRREEMTASDLAPTSFTWQCA